MKSFFLLPLFLLAVCSFALAQDEQTEGKEKKKSNEYEYQGFYYDKDRNKYFSNEKSIFSIRSTKDEKFLEKIEYSVDGQDFKIYNGQLNFVGEGPHQIRFRSVDPVSNWSPIQNFRIFVDKTAPRSQYVWKGPSYPLGDKLFIHPQTELNIFAQDNLCGVSNVYWKEKEGGDFKKFRGSQVFSKAGEHQLDSYAMDNVGNKEDVRKLSFFVDDLAPVTKANLTGEYIVKGKDIFVNTGSQMLLQATDNLSGIQRTEYSINKSLETTYANPIIISDSVTELRYRSIDNVGNKEYWQTERVFLDSKPPRISVLKNGRSLTLGGKVYARPGFALNVDLTDAESGIKEQRVSLDGKDYQLTDKKVYTFDKSGEYKFHLKATDNVGNVDESDPYTIVIDDTAPTVIMKSTEPLVPKDAIMLSAIPNRIYFEMSDDGVGPDRVEVSYDGETFKNFTAPIDLAEWTQEKRKLYYRAVDRLGNMSKVAMTEIAVRTNAPKVDLFVEPENSPEVPLSEIKNR